LLLEAARRDREQFGNPEKGEHLPLEAATKQRQCRRTVDTSVCVCVLRVTVYCKA
jgi:hypothetical protein